jgi:hypothetical protein
MQPIATLVSHIRYLTIDIGLRGSTTPEERKGHEYCQQVPEKLGLDARLEPFTSARSIFQPHLIAGIGLLIAFGVYPLAGQVSAQAAAVLALVILVSEVLEPGIFPSTRKNTYWRRQYLAQLQEVKVLKELEKQASTHELTWLFNRCLFRISQNGAQTFSAA